MTRLTRKLMISILTVVLSISALGTTTFAWFTLTNVATVESFSANIVSDTGIEISLDGVNWYNSLSPAVIQEYINTKYGQTAGESNFRFGHVTSADGVIFETQGSKNLVSAPASSYLSIRVLFRTSSVDTLQWTAATLQATTVQWLPDVVFSYRNALGNIVSTNTSSTISVNPANAMRMSVYSPFDIALQTDPLSPVVFEKIGGDYLGAWNSYLGAETSVNLTNGGLTGIGAPGAMNYYYVKTNKLPIGLIQRNETDSDWELATVSLATTVTDLNTSPIVMHFRNTDANTILNIGGEDITFGAPKGGYIFINIWFEGFDAEAYNSLLAEAVTVGFTFTGYPA